MDYEKAYKAVLKTAKQWIKDGCTDKEKICLECVFPELRESEDERIRKWLLECVENLSDGNFIEVSKQDVLFYLEKQKVNTEGDFGRGYDCGYQAGYSVAMNEMKPKVATAALDSEKQKEPHYTKRNALFDKCVENCDPEVMKEVSNKVDEMLGKEQKPVEKQDYSGLNDLERAIHRGFLCVGVENVPVGIIKETAKDCLAHLPAEWSEEDERVYDILLNEFKQLYDGRSTSLSRKEVIDVYNFVKSLRPSWKPSDEQIFYLSKAIKTLGEEGDYKTVAILNEIRLELKKF